VAVTAIEWAEKIEKILPRKTVKIKIKHLAEEKREIAVTHLKDK
jgi:tRNA A37 threonylcarbamoyladenosine biosynthesis protein TsaE